MQTLDIQQQKVTPQLASEWLKLNMTNRPLRDRNINDYATLMLRGLWSQTSPETIKFNTKGILLDGQHRLAAIVKSGISIDMLIHRNIPDDNFKVIDMGAKRSVGDILYITGVDNSMLVSTIITKYLLNIQSFGNKNVTITTHGKMKVAAEDVLKEYNSRVEFWDMIIAASFKFKKAFGKFLSPSLAAAWFAMVYDISANDAKYFFEQLTTGVGVTNAKHPISLLRVMFMNADSNRLFTENYKYAIFVKAWNSFRGKTNISRLSHRAGDTIYKLI